MRAPQSWYTEVLRQGDPAWSATAAEVDEGFVRVGFEIEDIERDDNFFALGGDSIISIQWSGRAANLGFPLTPQLIFEHMTIAELAAAVDDAMRVEPEPQDDFEAEPMSTSGLSADALSALGAAWKAK